MTSLRKRFERSPEFARLAPFAGFLLLTALQGEFGPNSFYWVYGLKTIVGAWLIWLARPYVEEMRWAFSWEAVAIGIGVCAVWIGLDGLYPRMQDLDEGSNPFKQFGAGSAAAWLYVAFHLGGSTIVVPPIEEVVYRSFLYRYLVKIDFRSMPLNRFHGLSFLVTSVIFGVVHPDRWLAGILCGMAYQWLVLRKNRLGDAMAAHAITNFLLGIWVVWKGAWNFWG